MPKEVKDKIVKGGPGSGRYPAGSGEAKDESQKDGRFTVEGQSDIVKSREEAKKAAKEMPINLQQSPSKVFSSEEEATAENIGAAVKQQGENGSIRINAQDDSSAVDKVISDLEKQGYYEIDRYHIDRSDSKEDINDVATVHWNPESGKVFRVVDTTFGGSSEKENEGEGAWSQVSWERIK